MSKDKYIAPGEDKHMDKVREKQIRTARHVYAQNLLEKQLPPPLEKGLIVLARGEYNPSWSEFGVAEILDFNKDSAIVNLDNEAHVEIPLAELRSFEQLAYAQQQAESAHLPPASYKTDYEAFKENSENTESVK